MKFKWFKEEEVKGLQIQFVMFLDMARDEAKIPFVLTSGFRTKEQNDAVGGAENSAHLRGVAVDIRCHTDQNRYKVISALLKVGLNRIGIYDDHIHVDADATLGQSVIWLK